MTPTLAILVAGVLMVVAALEKNLLSRRRGEPVCRRCRRERRYCSCPAQPRGGARPTSTPPA